MFWNQNTKHQTPEKCFGIKSQHTKRLRDILVSNQNTTNAWEMFLNQNTTHQKTNKCFGIKMQHIKHLRNVLE